MTSPCSDNLTGGCFSNVIRTLAPTSGPARPRCICTGTSTTSPGGSSCNSLLTKVQLQSACCEVTLSDCAPSFRNWKMCSTDRPTRLWPKLKVCEDREPAPALPDSPLRARGNIQAQLTITTPTMT